MQWLYRLAVVLMALSCATSGSAADGAKKVNLVTCSVQYSADHTLIETISAEHYALCDVWLKQIVERVDVVHGFSCLEVMHTVPVCSVFRPQQAKQFEMGTRVYAQARCVVAFPGGVGMILLDTPEKIRPRHASLRCGLQMVPKNGSYRTFAFGHSISPEKVDLNERPEAIEKLNRDPAQETWQICISASMCVSFKSLTPEGQGNFLAVKASAEGRDVTRVVRELGEPVMTRDQERMAQELLDHFNQKSARREAQNRK